MAPPQRLFSNLRNRHFLAVDAALLCLTPFLALLLRQEELQSLRTMVAMLAFYVIVALGVRLGIYYAGGIYERYWRFASIDDIFLLGRLHLLASTFLILFFVVLADDASRFCQALPPACSLPRTVPVIDMVLAFAAVSGIRYLARLLNQQQRVGSARVTAPRQQVLVVGAGETGAIIIREMQRNAGAAMDPVALVDDDPVKQRMKIYGVPVLGRLAELPQVAAACGATQVVVAMPSAPGAVIRTVNQQCAAAGLPVRVMPGISALLNGQVRIDRLRRVELEDLLRREPVYTDTAGIAAILRGRRVLVTGGGGSIGREICRQVLRCNPAALIVLGHGENSIFECTEELQSLPLPGGGPRPPIYAVIADVRFADHIQDVFTEHRPDFVFHAAAHKHVPLMEEHPREAVANNVLGTWNVLRAAAATQVERFVLISTDKAVNPTSVMGATKRVAELLIHRYAGLTGRPYLAVRFGNVLGSRGSVVLTFNRQIAAGGPITVTHPEVRRFFMTIPEAVQLSLQAATLGEGGEVFMLDMGEPVKIVDLARDLIELSGLRPEVDIEIKYTGLRPGEKLYEELFVPGEEYLPTSHAKVFRVVLDNALTPAALDAALNQLLAAAREGNAGAIRAGLGALVPEYVGKQTTPAPLPAHAASASLALRPQAAGDD